MAMLPGYKFTPKEEFLVGNVLWKRLRGEPLDGASANCIMAADVYGDDPARLTDRFPPTNREPCEWFFFSWCKLIKAKNVHGGGRADQEGRRKNRRKERAVRGAEGIELGQWRSTQAVKDVIQIDGSGCAVTIGYHQNFEYRDSNKQKSEWLMEEYGILPFLEAAGDEDKELVICKIYKTPAARRAEAKRSVSSPASPIPSPVSPSQHKLTQQQHPRPELLQPPPSRPSPPAVVPPNSPNPWPSMLWQASRPEQVLQPPFSSELLALPCQHDPLSPPLPPWHQPEQFPQLLLELDMPQHNNAMTLSAITAPFFSHDLVCPDGNQFVLDETRSSPDHRGSAVVNLQPHAVAAAHVCDDRTPVIPLTSQCTTAKISTHHTDSGSVLPRPDEQQQQPPPHAELDATARTCPKDPQLLERSAKRRKILGIYSSLFATNPSHRPTIRKAPTSAR